jgi:predicted phage terminase large subunit-like protein
MNDHLIAGAYALGRERLRDFSILMDPDYKPGWVHEVLAAKLEAVERGEIKRLIVEMPPRHGKTQLATINFPAWCLGRDHSREVITAAYNAELSQDFGGKTRDLISSPEYQYVFPGVHLKADTQSKSKWATEGGGSYTSVGVGGSLTGRGCDILLIDDPVKNREEAESPVVRQAILDWYTSTARTRLEKGAAVVIIMTRWHVYDLVGTLLERMENETGERWERVTFPAIATEDETYRKKGEPLWPEKYDNEALEATRKSLGERDWLALYQQTPFLSETADFRPEWFKQYKPADIKDKRLEIVTSVDLAISKKATADNVVVRTLGRDKASGDIYLLEEDAAHFDPGETIDILFRHVAMYKPLKVGIESVAYQKALAYFVVQKQKKDRVFFTIEEINQTGDKEARIRGTLAPMYKAGVIHHRPADSELESELLQFPQGKHDDRADALQMAVALLGNTHSVSFKAVRHGSRRSPRRYRR